MIFQILLSVFCIGMLTIPFKVSSQTPANDELLNILSHQSQSVGDQFSGGDELTEAMKNEIKGKNSLTPEQNIFFSFFEKKDYEKALFQWKSAFAHLPEFTNGSTGQALYAYLLFKNQLEVNAIRNLFQIESPEEIQKNLAKAWRLLAPPEHKVWKVVRLKWSSPWTDFFDVATEIQVRNRSFTEFTDRKIILELVNKTAVGTESRDRLTWVLAVNSILDGKINEAAQLISYLLKSNNKVLSQDLLYLTAARLLYQQGLLDPAINYYKKIPKESDYWLWAQEEKGWAYLRKGEPQNALAQTETLMQPLLAPQVGPEAVYLQALSFLKVCDYPSVLKTIDEFRIRFKNKFQFFIKFKEQGLSPSVVKWVDLLNKKKLTIKEQGLLSKELPRMSIRDEFLMDLIQVQNSLKQEMQAAENLYLRSLSGSSDRVGFQAQFEDLKQIVGKNWQGAQTAVWNRLNQLADDEVTEIQKYLQKMHIVSAELFQQLNQAKRMVSHSSQEPVKNQKWEWKKGTTGSQNKNALTFPMETESWFDEWTNYRVNIKKGCVAMKGSI